MINRLLFSIEIKVDKSTIWKVLWNDTYYRDWASIFFEGSYAVTDNWKEGSKVHFLSPDKSGIYSNIEKHVLNKSIIFKHLGIVKDGEELLIDNETKKWTGARETYTLTEGKESNTLTIEIDVLDEHIDFMKKTFPKALDKIKDNCQKLYNLKK